jgi:hypothetical protein
VDAESRQELPARWRRIEELFDAAVELAPDGREALLAAECEGDETLRGEVEDPVRHALCHPLRAHASVPGAP